MIRLRLPCREPFDGDSLLGFLAARAIPGVEEVHGGTYRRTLALEHGAGLVSLTPGTNEVHCELRLEDRRDLTGATARCTRLLDLDADPVAVAAHLERDAALSPLVRRHPGLRVPGCVDGFEIAVRAIVGQQVSVPAARTLLGRLAAAHGERVSDGGALTHRFPRPSALASLDPATLPFPRTRARALVDLARLAHAGELRLDPASDHAETRALLMGIPGVGRWTVDYVAMRALGDPDVFLAGDLGVRHALAALPVAPDVESWRPWRSYAVMQLWRSLDGEHAVRASARSPG